MGDYQRNLVARYYCRLMERYGTKSLIKHIPQLKGIVWRKGSVTVLEKRLERGVDFGERKRYNVGVIKE